MKRLLSEFEYELLIVSPSSNMRYLSGFTDEPGERILLLFVHLDEDPLFHVPHLYAEQVKRRSWIEEMVIWNDSDNPQNVLADTLSKFDLQKPRVLVDDEMWVDFFLMISEALSHGSFSRTSEVMVPLR